MKGECPDRVSGYHEPKKNFFENFTVKRLEHNIGDMKNNSTENRIAYNRSSAINKKEILSAKRQKFHSTCKDIDLSKEGTKAWSLLKNLNGENRNTNPKPLNDNGDTIADDQKRAERHNCFFATTNKGHKLTEEDKTMLKNLKAQEKAPRYLKYKTF